MWTQPQHLGLHPSLRTLWVRTLLHKLYAENEKEEGSASSDLEGIHTETDLPKDQFQCCIIVAKTVGGKVNLRAMNQGSGAPLLAFSPREAKSEILALSRDSWVRLASQDSGWQQFNKPDLITSVICPASAGEGGPEPPMVCTFNTNKVQGMWHLHVYTDVVLLILRSWFTKNTKKNPTVYPYFCGIFKKNKCFLGLWAAQSNLHSPPLSWGGCRNLRHISWANKTKSNFAQVSQEMGWVLLQFCLTNPLNGFVPETKQIGFYFLQNNHTGLMLYSKGPV